jgi:hypothetical protein
MAQRYSNYSPPVDWYTVIMSKYEQRGGTIIGQDFSQPAGRASEFFALYWASLVTSYINENDFAPPVIRAPYDKAMQSRHKYQLANPGSAQYGIELESFDTSYFYSPTFWLAPERYKTALQPTLNPTPQDGAKYWRRNRFEQCTYPSAKVLLFERFDFTRKSRIIEGPPQFNSPEGLTMVASVDGAVSEANMARLTLLANSSDPTVQAQFQPTGLFNISKQAMTYADTTATTNSGFPIVNDPWQNGPGWYSNVSTPAYPQFFWATRNGIRGRDLQR